MNLFQMIDWLLCYLGIPIAIVLILWSFVGGMLTGKEESSFGPSYGGMFGFGIILLIIGAYTCGC